VSGTRKGSPPKAGSLLETNGSAWGAVGFCGNVVVCGRSIRLGSAAIELAHGFSANRPRRDLRSRGLLAFGPLVGRADEAAFDEDMAAWAEDRDAMPLGLADPFVFGVLPGALRSDGKNDELRTVAFRLTLLRVGTNEPYESC
jgi:hypothetical protein